MLFKILEPFIALAAWLYLHGKLLIEALSKMMKFMVRTKIPFSIHTFIGAGLAVFYYYLFTGQVSQFHGFHSALSSVEVWLAPADGGVGNIFLIAIASVLLLTLTRGFFLFIGYTLIFWLYVILSAFETPRPLNYDKKTDASTWVPVFYQETKAKTDHNFISFGYNTSNYHIIKLRKNHARFSQKGQSKQQRNGYADRCAEASYARSDGRCDRVRVWCDT